MATAAAEGVGAHRSVRWDAVAGFVGGRVGGVSGTVARVAVAAVAGLGSHRGVAAIRGGCSTARVAFGVGGVRAWGTRGGECRRGGGDVADGGRDPCRGSCEDRSGQWRFRDSGATGAALALALALARGCAAVAAPGTTRGAAVSSVSAEAGVAAAGAAAVVAVVAGAAAVEYAAGCGTPGCSLDIGGVAAGSITTSNAPAKRASASNAIPSVEACDTAARSAAARTTTVRGTAACGTLVSRIAAVSATTGREVAAAAAANTRACRRPRGNPGWDRGVVSCRPTHPRAAGRDRRAVARANPAGRYSNIAHHLVAPQSALPVCFAGGAAVRAAR